MRSFAAGIKYLALLGCAVSLSSAAASPRERLSLNNGWTFSFGSPDDLGYSRYLNKGKNGTRGIAFSKDKPQSVRLPHDWAVDLPPSKDAYDVSAFTPVGFKFPETSIGWYKRTFAVPESDAGKTMWLEFDGIFRNAQIFLNQTFLARQEAGYSRASFDITDLVMPGKVNELWVRVDASQHEGWWYEGAGIYRNAWLVKTAPLAVAPDGVFVHPGISRRRARRIGPSAGGGDAHESRRRGLRRRIALPGARSRKACDWRRRP